MALYLKHYRKEEFIQITQIQFWDKEGYRKFQRVYNELAEKYSEALTKTRKARIYEVFDEEVRRNKDEYVEKLREVFAKWQQSAK